MARVVGQDHRSRLVVIHLTAGTPILFATDADFRKGIDGFVAIRSQQLHKNSRNGSLYVFFNRSATMIRILSYESNCYYMITKRLCLDCLYR